MKLTEIYELMNHFENSNISCLDLKLGDVQIKLEKAAAPHNGAFSGLQAALPQNSAAVQPTAAAEPAAPAAAQSLTEEKTIKSPIVGVYYNTPSPGKPLFVKEGARVKKGDVVCLIEAMKMFNNVTAPCDCVIKKILVENEALVEFDSPLFVIEEL